MLDVIPCCVFTSFWDLDLLQDLTSFILLLCFDALLISSTISYMEKM